MLKLNVASLTILVFLFVACSSPDSPNGLYRERRSFQELQKCAVITAKTIVPKDTATPPEKGGYGFEKLALQMGYQTNQVSKHDLQYFGDNQALKGGILSNIVGQFPATMRTEGKNSSYAVNMNMRALLYETLLELHPVTNEYLPGLATHWKIADNKMTFWFRLNPDARFSDGHPVTSEDVIATYDLLMDETLLFPILQLVYGKYKRPSAEGKYIVRVECNVLNWRNFLYFGNATYIYPARYLKDLSGTEYLEQYHHQILPGTGPYTILMQDVQNQVSYALTRRLDYWDGANPLKKNLYNFDKIKYVVVKDNPTLSFEKFKKGEQDVRVISSTRRWIEDCNFHAVQMGWIQKRKIYSQRPSGRSGYAFNLRKPPFDDRRVRYAFTYLLNRERINHDLFFDEYLLQNSHYAGSAYENETNEKISYNPSKAVRLLAEAGWKERNKYGWLINDKGEEFRIRIRIPKDIDFVVTTYQQNLKSFGIDLQIEYMDGNTLWKMVMERNFSIYYMSFGGLLFPNPENSLHSSLADKNNTNNIYGFKNARVDELCALYDREFDPGKRLDIIHEIDAIIAAERIAAWTYYYPYIRFLYWEKFGFPEYMLSRYGDNTIHKYWWYDPQKIRHLREAMKNDHSLPKGELINTYWLDLKNH